MKKSSLLAIALLSTSSLCAMDQAPANVNPDKVDNIVFKSTLPPESLKKPFEPLENSLDPLKEASKRLSEIDNWNLPEQKKILKDISTYLESKSKKKTKKPEKIILADIYNKVGVQLFKQKDFSQALSFFENSISHNKSSIRYSLNHADCLLNLYRESKNKKPNELKEIQKELEAIESETLNSEEQKDLARYQYELGSEFLKNKNSMQACDFYKKATDNDASKIYFLNYMESLLEVYSQKKSSIIELSKVCKEVDKIKDSEFNEGEKSRLSWIYNELGIKYLHLNQHNKAIEFFQKAQKVCNLKSYFANTINSMHGLLLEEEHDDLEKFKEFYKFYNEPRDFKSIQFKNPKHNEMESQLLNEVKGKVDLKFVFVNLEILGKGLEETQNNNHKEALKNYFKVLPFGSLFTKNLKDEVMFEFYKRMIESFHFSRNNLNSIELEKAENVCLKYLEKPFLENETAIKALELVIHHFQKENRHQAIVKILTNDGTLTHKTFDTLNISLLESLYESQKALNSPDAPKTIERALALKKSPIPVKWYIRHILEKDDIAGVKLLPAFNPKDPLFSLTNTENGFYVDLEEIGASELREIYSFILSCSLERNKMQLFYQCWYTLAKEIFLLGEFYKLLDHDFTSIGAGKQENIVKISPQKWIEYFQQYQLFLSSVEDKDKRLLQYFKPFLKNHILRLAFLHDKPATIEDACYYWDLIWNPSEDPTLASSEDPTLDLNLGKMIYKNPIIIKNLLFYYFKKGKENEYTSDWKEKIESLKNKNQANNPDLKELIDTKLELYQSKQTTQEQEYYLLVERNKNDQLRKMLWARNSEICNLLRMIEELGKTRGGTLLASTYGSFLQTALDQISELTDQIKAYGKDLPDERAFWKKQVDSLEKQVKALTIQLNPEELEVTSSS